MANMLRSRLLRLPQSTSSIRAFTTSTISRDASHRSPALGDITPSGGPDFEAKQKQFREDVAVAKRKKEQAESQLRNHFNTADSHVQVQSQPDVDSNPDVSVSQPAHPDIPSVSPDTGLPLGLGSLSVNQTGEQRQSEQDTTTKRGGKLSSLIYGTPEGQQLDQEMERSFSQLLARGKYVHSIVFHDVKPDKVDEYVKTVGDWYPKVAANPDNKVNLVGSWRSEIGDCDTFGELSNLTIQDQINVK